MNLGEESLLNFDAIVGCRTVLVHLGYFSSQHPYFSTDTDSCETHDFGLHHCPTMFERLVGKCEEDVDVTGGDDRLV